MPTTYSAILLTGQPNIGKTTLLKQVMQSLTDYGGFYTQEVRENGIRTAFEITTTDGQIATLASRMMDDKHEPELKVGPYQVHLDAVDLVAVPAIQDALAKNRVVVIDEIGPMEIFSQSFCGAVMEVLDAPHVMLFGTIVERPYQFADDIKKRSDVKVITIDKSNRDSMYDTIMTYFEQ